MSFLYPLMLAGIAGIAVPVILHLIARHRFPVQDFPSIRLLQAEKRANVFAFKLVDKAQLLLRALLLLLLALAMARPFLNTAKDEPPPFNRVVVLDCSSSMKMTAENASGGAARPASLMEVAKNRGTELLSEVEEPGHSACVLAGRVLEQDGNTRSKVGSLLPGHAESVPIVQMAEAIDGEGEGLVSALGRACGLLQGRHEIRSQIVVLSDMRRSAFAARNQANIEKIRRVEKELGDRLDVVFVDVRAEPQSNFGLLDGYVRGGAGQVGEDAHIVARIEHFTDRIEEPEERGDSNAESKKPGSGKTIHARLRIGQQKEPFVREIALQPGSQAVVDMTTRVNKAVETFAQVYLQDPDGVASPDAMSEDDRFAVPLEVADVLRVLIIDGTAAEKDTKSEVEKADGGVMTGGLGGDMHGAPHSEEESDGESISGVRILQYVLNPARELGRRGGTGINASVVTLDGLANQPLSKYQIICLYDVSSLSAQALSDLETFTKQGGALLLIVAENCNPMKFNRTLASAGAANAEADGRGMIAPARVGNERTLKSPVGVALGSESMTELHPVLAPFRDQRRGDLSVVRFSKLRKLRGLARGAEVIVQSEPLGEGKRGIPLVVERDIGDGRVVLLTFGFELDRGNVARTRVFPVLMWRIVDYLTKNLERKPPDILTAMRPAVLDVSEPRFAFVDEVELVPVKVAREKSAEKNGENGDVNLSVQKERETSLAEPLILPIAEDRTVLVPAIPTGLYRLQKVRTNGGTSMFSARSRYVTVNPDPAESDLDLVSGEDLNEIAGESWSRLQVGETLSFAPEGWEAWKWLVLALVVLYAGEGFVGWWLSARREKERADELPSFNGEGTEA